MSMSGSDWFSAMMTGYCFCGFVCIFNEASRVHIEENELQNNGKVIEVVQQDAQGNDHTDTLVVIPLNASGEFRKEVYQMIKDGRLQVTSANEHIKPKR